MSLIEDLQRDILGPRFRDKRTLMAFEEEARGRETVHLQVTGKPRKARGFVGVEIPVIMVSCARRDADECVRLALEEMESDA